MPSKKQYDLVMDDGLESKSPLHDDAAFQHGIYFQAKYIGTMDVPRPGSRVEIVGAMRRIRYEFKSKGIRKQKVVICVSVEGVKVSTQKKNRRKPKWSLDDIKLVLSQHPIYRIFYVSHDSQDLKIFSYIARDGSTNIFKCNVFKSYKKHQAMQIVRTIGQAFEVCHRISVQSELSEEAVEAGSSKSLAESGPAATNSSSTLQTSPRHSSQLDGILTSSEIQSPEEAIRQTQQLLSALQIGNGYSVFTVKTPSSVCSPLEQQQSSRDSSCAEHPSASSQLHRAQLVLAELELQTQQTQFLYTQMQLFKDQLDAERAAKMDAQARTNDLLTQNRSLLAHMNFLISRLAELEHQAEAAVFNRAHNGTGENSFVHNSISIQPHAAPRSQVGTMQEEGSPDSGHKDMSSDTSSNNTGQSSSSGDSWHTPTSTGQTTVGAPVSAAETRPNPRLGFTLPLKNTTTGAMLTSEPANSRTQEALLEFEKSKSNSMKCVAMLNGKGAESSVAPRIEPPPKARRSSSRSSHVSPLAPISDSPVFRSQEWSAVEKETKSPEKRHSWESYLLADKNLATVINDNALSPPVEATGTELNGNGRLLIGLNEKNNRNEQSNGCEEMKFDVIDAAHIINVSNDASKSVAVSRH